MVASAPEHNVLRWNTQHALLMCVAIGAVIAGVPISLWVGTVWLSLISYLYLLRATWSGHRFFIGVANSITLFRLLIVSVVCLVYPAPSAIVCGWLLIFALCLDGVDGFFARRYSESSIAGQYLDVEVDAFAIAVMSVLLWQKLDLSIVFVLAGSLRYLYVLSIKYIIKLERAEPKRRYASLIAVLAYISMVLELAFQHSLTYIAVVVGIVLLTGSFLRSFVYQWQGE